MPLNSVQLYIKSQLNGLQLPLTQQGVTAAYIAPPNPGVIEQPLIYIWGAIDNESPATTASQKLMYDVDLWVYWVEDSDDPLADSLFPIVLDAIKAQLRGLKRVLPAQITDPVTGLVSDLLAVGRHMKTDYAPARTLENEAMTLYMAHIIVGVEEWVQA